MDGDGVVGLSAGNAAGGLMKIAVAMPFRAASAACVWRRRCRPLQRRRPNFSQGRRQLRQSELFGLAQTTPSDIGKLGGAWHVHLEGGANPQGSNPASWRWTACSMSRRRKAMSMPWMMPQRPSNGPTRAVSGRNAAVRTYTAFDGNHIAALDQKRGDRNWSSGTVEQTESDSANATAQSPLRRAILRRIVFVRRVAAGPGFQFTVAAPGEYFYNDCTDPRMTGKVVVY